MLNGLAGWIGGPLSTICNLNERIVWAMTPRHNWTRALPHHSQRANRYANSNITCRHIWFVHAFSESGGEGGPMARNTGHWKEFADATGIDAAYAAHQAEADRELRDALVIPRGEGLVAAGDADMKNPNGEFQHPSPMQGAATGRGTQKPSEPEGQQGATVRQWESWAKPVGANNL